MIKYKNLSDKKHIIYIKINLFFIKVFNTTYFEQFWTLKRFRVGLMMRPDTEKALSASGEVVGIADIIEINSKSVSLKDPV